MSIPKTAKLVEVGPRDGLQNESLHVPTDIKIELINKLSATGLTTIEATSFVSPTWVPQLADANQVFSSLSKQPGITYPVLVPNEQGLQDALAAGANCIAVFTAVSETFSQKNTNCSIAKSLQRLEQVINLAHQHKLQIRGYISCVLGCPYEGQTDLQKTAEIADELNNLGCYEISLGDTIGVGTPLQAKKLIELVTKKVSINKLAVHFHDAYGQALANIYAVLEQGIAIIDSSIAGLGGCPYAKGSPGNVATEDVLYMLDGMKIATSVDLTKLLQVSQFVAKTITRNIKSKVALAMLKQI